ncbi:hypothetical protein NDU88_005914 [Pleurodeles waltl]|uniref:Uncharacterized protein n=1 Tax=Pleurodeles waltl TaxID=8319 RepID=A0AAV7WCV5_PLEWA|nr:hypothetical protein NDU88_005914 [Pleurodeles waltl]
MLKATRRRIGSHEPVGPGVGLACDELCCLRCTVLLLNAAEQPDCQDGGERRPCVSGEDARRRPAEEQQPRTCESCLGCAVLPLSVVEAGSGPTIKTGVSARQKRRRGSGAGRGNRSRKYTSRVREKSGLTADRDTPPNLKNSPQKVQNKRQHRRRRCWSWRRKGHGTQVTFMAFLKRRQQH